MSARQFVVELADEADKTFIAAELARLGRQTMNVRTMPTYEMLVLRDADQGTIAGWQGLDFRHRPGFAEVFSLQVYPAYRGCGLGLLLEHMAACHLLEHGVSSALVRMDLAGNGDLVRWRLGTGCWVCIDEDALDASFVRACGACELYGATCLNQIYLRFLLPAFRSFAEQKIGAPAAFRLPQGIAVGDGVSRYLG